MRIWIYVAPGGCIAEPCARQSAVYQEAGWSAYTVDVEVPGLNKPNIPATLEAGPVVEVKP